MTTKINVLDHGFVRLVDHMGDDLSIVQAARVSYDAEWRTGEDAGKDEKLIAYLMRNNHTSPFEMVEFKFEVKAPIFVFRQWHRHRTWSFNEISGRYAELPEEYYVPEVGHIGIQSAHNKQMRDFVENDAAPQAVKVMELANSLAFSDYHYLLNLGVPRELARSILPVATYSHMFAKVDLHNLFHFLRLRLHSHAQYETRVYAEAMLQLIEPIVPVAVKYFKEYNNG